MSEIIAVCNQKGGVGKTTTAINLSTYLALSGKKILLVDIDPQANATSGLGLDKKTVEEGTYQFLLEEASPEKVIKSTEIAGLSLVPSNEDLMGAEVELVSEMGREGKLKRALAPLTAQFDFIFIDSPPSLGLLTVNALVAADRTLIPVQCEYLALEGLNALMHAVNLIKQQLNPGLKVGGIVLTMTDFRANLSKEVADEVKRFFKDLVFDTAIPRNIRLAESPSFGKPICLYDPHSTGALAYHLLTQEVISKEGAG